MQLKQCVAVARRAVTQAEPFCQRAGIPHGRACLDQHYVHVRRHLWRKTRQPGHYAWGPMAPLDEHMRSAGTRGSDVLGPVNSLVFEHRGSTQGLDTTVIEHVAPFGWEQRCATQ